MITRFDIAVEAKKLREGRPTRVCARTIALCTTTPERKTHGDAVEFLESLFKLEDPRGMQFRPA